MVIALSRASLFVVPFLNITIWNKLITAACFGKNQYQKHNNVHIKQTASFPRVKQQETRVTGVDNSSPAEINGMLKWDIMHVLFL